MSDTGLRGYAELLSWPIKQLG